MTPRELGHRLRMLRADRELRQQDVAERADVPAYQISRLEAGLIRHPNVFEIERLASFYGLSINQLLEKDTPDHADQLLRAKREGMIEAARNILREASGQLVPHNGLYREPGHAALVR